MHIRVNECEVPTYENKKNENVECKSFIIRGLPIRHKQARSKAVVKVPRKKC